MRLVFPFCCASGRGWNSERSNESNGFELDRTPHAGRLRSNRTDSPLPAPRAIQNLDSSYEPIASESADTSARPPRVRTRRPPPPPPPTHPSVTVGHGRVAAAAHLCAVTALRWARSRSVVSRSPKSRLRPRFRNRPLPPHGPHVPPPPPPPPRYGTTPQTTHPTPAPSGSPSLGTPGQGGSAPDQAPSESHSHRNPRAAFFMR